jgi:hypothetical protein
MAQHDRNQNRTSPSQPTQPEINEGQKNINGGLCYVDWHVIYTIDKLMKALIDHKVLTDEQLSEAFALRNRAYYTSTRVAEIDPPGCGQNFPKEEEKPPAAKAA